MVNSLELDHISVRYGSVLAVDAVSLQLDAGEIVALLGASGSGKSSVLRAVAGLEPLVGGGIRLAGQDLAHTPTHKRGVGLMFQDGQLFPHRTVAGNVGYGLRSLPRPARAARVADMLEIVDLADYGAREINTLSGGQAQRVALARALAPAPQVLLLDEPLSALDRNLRGRLTEVLSHGLRSTGTTALMVTHDPQEAFAIADRVGVMADGRLIAIDTPDQLRSTSDPQVTEVLGEVGSGPEQAAS